MIGPIKEKEKTGTSEWVKPNCKINSQDGCYHNCDYCFGKTFCDRFHKRDLDWGNQKMKLVKIRRTKDLLMYPSTHDFIPLECRCNSMQNARETLSQEQQLEMKKCYDYALETIKVNLHMGNKLLLVTKPHEKFLDDVFQAFSLYKDKITFRFTITSMNDYLLAMFEKNAPRFKERMECVSRAIFYKFKTTVSLEPFLDEDPIILIKKLISDHPEIEEIWLGGMSKVPKSRFTKEELDHMAKIYKRDNMLRIYQEVLKMNDPRIKFKHSFMRVIKNPKRSDLQKEIAGPGYIWPGQENKPMPVKIEEGCIVYYEIIENKKYIHFVDLPRSRR